MFGAALGVSKYCSRQKLWRILTGREKPDEENDAMRRGTLCEPLAIDWYEVEKGEIVTPAGFVPHPVFDWCGVSPDGYVGSGRIEVKCPVNGCHDQIPEHYRPQVIGVLHITGGEWIDFVSWHPEGVYLQRVMAADTKDEWFHYETELELYWHKYVLADKEPPRKQRKK